MRPSAAHMEPGAGVTARDMRTRSARPARGPQNTGELLKATPPARARMGGASRLGRGLIVVGGVRQTDTAPEAPPLLAALHWTPGPARRFPTRAQAGSCRRVRGVVASSPAAEPGGPRPGLTHDALTADLAPTELRDLRQLLLKTKVRMPPPAGSSHRSSPPGDRQNRNSYSAVKRVLQSKLQTHPLQRHFRDDCSPSPVTSQSAPVPLGEGEIPQESKSAPFPLQ